MSVPCLGPFIPLSDCITTPTKYETGNHNHSELGEKFKFVRMILRHVNYPALFSGHQNIKFSASSWFGLKMYRDSGEILQY